MFRSQSMGAHNGILNLFKISQIDVLLCLHFTFSHDGTRLVWDRPHRMACIIFKLEDFYFASRVAYMKTIWMWMFAVDVWKSVCDVCAFAQRVIRRSSGCSRQMHFEGVAFVLFEQKKTKRKTHWVENNAPSHQQTITITTAYVWLSEWQHFGCFVSTWGSQPVRERAPTIIYLSFLVLRLELNRFYYCSIHFVSRNSGGTQPNSTNAWAHW